MLSWNPRSSTYFLLLRGHPYSQAGNVSSHGDIPVQTRIVLSQQTSLMHSKPHFLKSLGDTQRLVEARSLPHVWRGIVGVGHKPPPCSIFPLFSSSCLKEFNLVSSALPRFQFLACYRWLINAHELMTLHNDVEKRKAK